MKFVYFNDTGRTITIHPASFIHGCTSKNKEPIAHLEERVFYLPEGTYPFVKMWDYGEERGLQILISPTRDDC
ncbi:hypothetical protein [Saliterribacillus persicus]|uniref:Uncharacterized protein n=1 Tax=Saliterribacillus persicus TaxID=930114 RepID=A0A368X571_9BACI|nr:hypothetical protein [Saliterribacillus persicus]RCW62965.1 hypothetical protein DFR57_1212 [Saliterribacillus persicus]